jgi:hypothetical protein
MRATAVHPASPNFDARACGLRRPHLPLAATAVLALLFVGNATVAAQPRRAETTRATSDEERRARELFAQGSAAYDTGDYETGLAAFSDAYALSGRPRLLHNMYLCAERLGRPAEAARYLRRYLDEEDDIDNRESLVVRLSRLEDRAARERTASTGAPSAVGDDPSPRDDRSARGPGVGPWLLVGAGAASAIAGGVLVGLALGDVARIEDPAAGARWSEVADAYDRTVPMSGAGFALLGVGLAAAGAGVVWLATSDDADSERTRATAAFGIGPAGLVMRGSF